MFVVFEPFIFEDIPLYYGYHKHMALVTDRAHGLSHCFEGFECISPFWPEGDAVFFSGVAEEFNTEVFVGILDEYFKHIEGSFFMCEVSEPDDTSFLSECSECFFADVF